MTNINVSSNIVLFCIDTFEALVFGCDDNLVLVSIEEEKKEKYNQKLKLVCFLTDIEKIKL